MKAQWSRFGVGAMLIFLMSPPCTVFAQSLKEHIVATWRLVSIYNEPAGAKQNLYGDKPLGLTVFDRSGYVVQYISKADIPKFAGENRLKGTDQEYRTVMQSIILNGWRAVIPIELGRLRGARTKSSANR